MLLIDALWSAAQAIPPFITALAAATGAGVAILGYRKWQPESVGKRKIELAEDILAGFYEARDIIEEARLPLSYEGEGSVRERSDNESEDEAKAKDAYYVTIKRLQEHNALFASLLSKQYRAMAYFGNETKNPFDRIKAVRAKIAVAASSLIRHYPRHDRARPAAWDRWEARIGWGVDPDARDEIAEEVEAIIKEVEATYGKWLLRVSG